MGNLRRLFRRRAGDQGEGRQIYLPPEQQAGRHRACPESMGGLQRAREVSEPPRGIAGKNGRRAVRQAAGRQFFRKGGETGVPQKLCDAVPGRAGRAFFPDRRECVALRALLSVAGAGQRRRHRIPHQRIPRPEIFAGQGELRRRRIIRQADFAGYFQHRLRLHDLERGLLPANHPPRADGTDFNISGGLLPGEIRQFRRENRRLQKRRGALG